ncbi:MAG: hypothetical protein ACOX71_01760 [Lachnospiraceae bacterium]
MKAKKMLLIAPMFFGYYKEILKTAGDQGFEADYLCDAPSNTNISKALGRLNKKLIGASTKKYFNERVRPVIESKKYDNILVIAGMSFSFTAGMIGEIRNSQKDALFVLYQWDGEKNLPYVKSIHGYFDRVFTFDRIDALKDSVYRHLPLFYISSYEKIAGMKAESLYDCSYVGTAHPKKFREINLMADALKDVLPRQFIYHYMPSRLKYLYHKLTSPEYKGVKFESFRTGRLSASEITDILVKSRCVLDAPQEGQNGLTIRAIECIGAKKKLVTANPDIKNYDFYRENNILVLENGMGNIDPGSGFFTEDYEELPREIYTEYSLDSWLRRLFS